MSYRPMVGVILRAALVACLGMLAGSHAKARETVALQSNYPAGVIIIKKGEKRLYLTISPGVAIRYPIAVGKAGKAWSGVAHVDGKYVQPAWSPPDEVKRDNPRLPAVIAGGSPSNPMGARALTLDRSEIAIHGTTRAMRASVGTAASYGCIRMYNEDVIDLFERVAVGTPVIAIN
ncbi:MAG: ErfK/YbiS/YcfS/YnhG family protein [Hyphomicrobiales bacterium]|nr:ErfK/YbiS/YcfS/YnhG family protein [Hyphomicrobiales bacterium]